MATDLADKTEIEPKEVDEQKSPKVINTQNYPTNN